MKLHALSHGLLFAVGLFILFMCMQTINTLAPASSVHCTKIQFFIHQISQRFNFKSFHLVSAKDSCIHRTDNGISKKKSSGKSPCKLFNRTHLVNSILVHRKTLALIEENWKSILSTTQITIMALQYWKQKKRCLIKRYAKTGGAYAQVKHHTPHIKNRKTTQAKENRKKNIQRSKQSPYGIMMMMMVDSVCTKNIIGDEKGNMRGKITGYKSSVCSFDEYSQRTEISELNSTSKTYWLSGILNKHKWKSAALFLHIWECA